MSESNVKVEIGTKTRKWRWSLFKMRVGIYWREFKYGVIDGLLRMKWLTITPIYGVYAAIRGSFDKEFAAHQLSTHYTVSEKQAKDLIVKTGSFGLAIDLCQKITKKETTYKKAVTAITNAKRIV